MNPLVHVAVGVIVDENQHVLLAKRQSHQHQGGLWEFPGGKVEQTETVFYALKRELREELGIQVRAAEPFLKVSYQYPDKHVLLDVWCVLEYDGKPVSKERQPLHWIPLDKLRDYAFPKANQAIVQALELDNYYAITGDYQDEKDFFNRFERCLVYGARLIQLRTKHLNNNVLEKFTFKARQLCEQHRARLVVNALPEILDKVDVDGIHLASQHLFNYVTRPVEWNKLLCASVHNEKELQQAMNIGVDFVVISPVFETPSHPGAKLLEIEGLTHLVHQSSCPVFALGGMSLDDMDKIKETGAYGIAGISAFWPQGNID